MSDLPLGHERAARCGNVVMAEDRNVPPMHGACRRAAAGTARRFADVMASARTHVLMRREQIAHAVFERNGEIAIFPKSSEGGRDGK